MVRRAMLRLALRMEQHRRDGDVLPSGNAKERGAAEGRADLSRRRRTHREDAPSTEDDASGVGDAAQVDAPISRRR